MVHVKIWACAVLVVLIEPTIFRKYKVGGNQSILLPNVPHAAHAVLTAGGARKQLPNHTCPDFVPVKMWACAVLMVLIEPTIFQSTKLGATSQICCPMCPMPPMQC